MEMFLTSATGFLGAYLADYFLKENIELFVLARDAGNFGAKDRVLKALSLSNFESKNNLNKLNIIRGDITKNNLGIAEKDWRFIRNIDIQSLWHSAGSVDFSNQNKSTTFEINWQGMKNVLKFAERIKIREIHYISTAYSSGNQSVTAYDQGAKSLPAFNNPYEESKRLSEDLLLQWSINHPEVMVFIYQPSIVVGDRLRGRVFNLSGYYRYLRVFYNLRKIIETNSKMFSTHCFKSDQGIRLPITVPGHSLAEINLITIDYLIDILMKLQAKKMPGIYPIVNTRAPCYGDLLKNSLRALGIFGPTTIDQNSLSQSDKTLQKIETKVARGMRDYLPYINRTYHWDYMVTKDCLGNGYEEQSLFDYSLIAKLMDYVVKNDFVIKV